MSTVGFLAPTPTNGETLQMGTAYTFCIGVIDDDSSGASDDVRPVVSAGAATLDPDQQQMIGDTDSSAEASQQSWTITPTAAGPLTIYVELAGVMVTVAASTSGSRTHTVASAAARRSPRTSIGLGLGL